MNTVSRTLLSLSICAALSGSAFAQGTATKPAPDAVKPATHEHIKAKPAKKAKVDAPAESGTSAPSKGLPHATKPEVTPKTDKVAEPVVKTNEQPVAKEAAHHDAKPATKATKASVKSDSSNETKPVK